jgi:hypothetical protein
MRLIKTAIGTALLVLSLVAAPVWAATPTADGFPVQALETIDHFHAPIVDAEAARLEDDDREFEGLPPRFAIPFSSQINTDSHGTWEELGDGNRLWRLRISSPGTPSLNLGFTQYRMPEGARLLIYAADGSYGLRPFTSQDNADHGELWTPVVLSDDIVVELTIPVKAMDQFALELGSVNVTYRGFGEILPPGERSGSCNNDVVCPEGDDWRSEIPSVGVYTINGSWFCTGAIINNTAQDGTPYFLTANHCGVTTGNDQGVVIYWNFESPNCGDQCCGDLSQFNSGVIHRVSYSASDMTLVELEEPLNPAHGVTYSGWDRSTGDQSSAVAIHHPSTDEKAISFEYDPTTTTSYLNNSIPGNGTHIRVTDWDDGTTEPGSSGSPLYSPNHHIVGQLHGGYASCSSQTSDWYGRLSVSWVNGLSGYLDPLGTGAMTLDTYDPNATGMLVTPGAGFDAAGDLGGPFTPSSEIYTVENNGDAGFNFSVSDDAAWLDLSNTGGYLAPGNSATVTVSVNATANGLPIGGYVGTVSFVNTTDGDGDTARAISLTVGVPSLQLSENFDSNPGWTTQGQWAFGDPTGGGGEHGNNDPNTGFDGPNVYGYNLAGDYTNNMAETHLTSTPFDCSTLSATSVKFRRWLNVEQPSYDHAYLRVSNDNSNWTTVWQNGGEVADSGWQYVEYDISDVADGASTVYLRWTMGTTDGSWLYSGWNIDNVEIWGLGGDMTGVGEAVPARSGLLRNVPNPFNPKTEIHFALAVEAQVELAVFDVSGRRIATLLGGKLPAGQHSEEWNGIDDAGRPVSSGIYFARLATDEGLVDTQKLTLLK